MDAVPGRNTAGGRGTSGGAREDTGHTPERRGKHHGDESGGGAADGTAAGAENHQTLAVGAGVFDGIKIGHGWVESPGRSVSETATVFASVTQRELDNATLNQLAQSGSHLRLYSAQDAARTTRSCRGIPPSAWSQSS
uniref:Multifunctional conjugation protein TraI n=1 Tax=Klebsiella pneumoniae TaxID=573 RepID=A0A2P1BNZ8_KLEPN|nr:Multifunctional conjugation protein TraI [Klebsiella pneumoniae]